MGGVNPKVFCVATMSCPRQLGLQIDYSVEGTVNTLCRRLLLQKT
jgi:hypothetical protein